MNRGVLWKQDTSNNRTQANLIIDNAKAVYDHLLEWCEGDYQSWFMYMFKKFNDGYVISVHPNIKNSVERMKRNAAIMYGNKFDKELNKEYNILYRPLTCVGMTNKTIETIPEFDHTKINIALVDTLDLQAKNYDNCYELKGLNFSTEYEGHLDNSINDYRNHIKGKR